MANPDYQTEILHHSDSLEEWDSFVDASPQGCIFCQSWWLKTVCPDGFKILTLQKNGKIIAGMPLPVSRKLGYAAISMPPLTQTLGALLLPSKKTTYEGRLSDEMDVLESLVAAIPRFGYFSTNFHYTFTNWLPFYWAGYQQTTRYTYVIEDLTDLETLFSNFAPQLKNKIRKASNHGVSIIESDDIEIFLEINRKTFIRQGMELPYPSDMVRRIDKECALREARKIFIAKDEQSRIHSALFVVYDKKSMYNLMQGGDPALRESGANPLAMWHSIEFAQKVTQRYDFEGSMIPQVEPFFRSFGAIQTPYFRITKDNRSLPVKAGLGLYRLARGALRKAGLR